MSSLVLGVVFVIAPELDLRVSDLYSAAEQTIARESTLELAPLDIFSDLASRDASRACAGDAACYVAKARETGRQLDLLLIASVARLDGRLFVALRLTGADGAALGAYTHPVDAEVPVHRAVGEVVGRVFPSEMWKAPARLSISSTPTGVEAQIGDRICRTPCTLDRLRAGPYSISIVDENHRPWNADRTLEPGASVTVDARLEPTSTGWYERPWIWGAAAVVVAGAVVAGVVVASGRDSLDRVCVWHDPARC